MFTGLLHLHSFVVFTFLVLYTYKVILLLTNNVEKLNKIREKKIIDIILGVLILATGGFLFLNSPLKPMWLIVKLIVVLLLIPMGIVAMKKENKVLAILPLVGFVYFVAVSYTNSLTIFSKNNIETKSEVEIKSNEELLTHGKSIFESKCAVCHGVDGKLMAGGAKDISVSKMEMSERIILIKEGKNLMSGFENELSEQDIKAVAEYSATLK